MDLESQTYYDILEVNPTASMKEIKLAYQIALRTYGTDNIATYSIFTPEERESILAKVHEAYKVLADVDTRRLYDEELRSKGLLSTEMGASERDGVREEGVQEGDTEAEDRERDRLVEALVEAVLQGEEKCSGSLIRRIRELRGIELNDIARRTRIGISYLQAIEEDEFHYLPPDVYVKGFITQVLKLLKVEHEGLVPRLMDHIRARRQRGRGRS